MKNLLFVFTIFCILNANAQNYLISFAGTGASTMVNTVEVENLTAGASLTINGSDLLRLTSTVGISDTENEKSSGIKIYPNPMTDKSTLLISAPNAGDAIISVCDITGKILTQIKSYVENYTQEFTLSGLKNGIYFINVKGNTYQLSGKLISRGRSIGTTSIEKAGDKLAGDKKLSIIDAKGVQATIDMEYTTGDILKFTGISGNYSTVVTTIPDADETVTFEFVACTDGDGNNYPVVKIGTQTWMAENLKTTRYRNTDLIGTTTPATLDISLESTPGYQWAYDGNESNVATYGRLYTWYAITDSRFVCPTGWHVPTDADWTTLTDYLGGEYVAGGKLKETGYSHWESYIFEATNETGFTGLPGGSRNYSGTFLQYSYFGFWWSATEYNASTPWNRSLEFLSSSVQRLNNHDKKNGLSVRCMKDN